MTGLSQLGIEPFAPLDFDFPPGAEALPPLTPAELRAQLEKMQLAAVDQMLAARRADPGRLALLAGIAAALVVLQKN